MTILLWSPTTATTTTLLSFCPTRNSTITTTTTSNTGLSKVAEGETSSSGITTNSSIMSASTATVVPPLAGSSGIPDNNTNNNNKVSLDQQDDFTTPDRSKLHTGAGTGGDSSLHHNDEKKDDSENNNSNSGANLHHLKPATVTPAETSLSTKLMGQRDRNGKDDDDDEEEEEDDDDDINDEDSKRVRFDHVSAVAAAVAATNGGGAAGTDSASTSSADSPSKRGLVSRRGGRAASPGRTLTSVSPVNKEAAAAAVAVLEFKTYRSPDRKSGVDDAPASEEIDVVGATLKEKGSGDTVPSLCSTNSMKEEDEGDVKEEPAKQQQQQQQQPQISMNDENNGSGSSSRNNSNKNSKKVVGNGLPPKTSMLQPKPSGRPSYDKASDNGATGSRETEMTQSVGSGISVGGPKKSNVTFSPVPPPKESMDHRRMKTPVRSPAGGRFTGLPHLDDASLTSPGIFLSPNTPTRLDRRTKDSSTLLAASTLAGVAHKAPLTPKSPRTPRRDLDRFLATPTEFAFDYVGGGKFNADTSNVLAWLHSPTSNGLFSPGGLGSMLNTPKGGMPRTPRSPSVSTSFFFSDVAGLPREGEFSPTKQVTGDSGTIGGSGGVTGKRGGERGVAPSNSIIYISPLASSKASGRQSGHSPNLNRDMFASPAERSGMSMLGVGVSPTNGLLKARSTIGVQKGADLDAVHLAERDLMEDEDLSVLLQLASNTPCPSTGGRPMAVSTSDGETAVFRSPESNNSGGGENLPTLQLPMIGAHDGDGNSARLSRKTHSRDYNESPTSDRHIRPMLHTSASTSGARSASEDSRQDTARPSNTSSMHPTALPYSITSHYPHHEASYYPPMHPGMSLGGSMRVVVGGPHPSRGSKSPPGGSPPGMRPYSRGPQGEYPPPYNPYPPRHGVAQPPHMHPLYTSYPPPLQHHVNPRHGMPIYGGAQVKASSSATSPSKKPIKSSSAGTTTTKPGVKRPAPPVIITPQSPPPVPPSKKVKKVSSSTGSTPKKKNRSPQLVDKADRQKAAATIHSVNAASGGKNDKAAALAAAILRGVTMRPSGKWQAQLYFAGKSRYIGVFDTREKAALAYEIAREKLKSEKNAEGGALTPKQTEAAVNAARKAAFEGVNERDPRVTGAN